MNPLLTNIAYSGAVALAATAASKVFNIANPKTVAVYSLAMNLFDIIILTPTRRDVAAQMDVLAAMDPRPGLEDLTPLRFIGLVIGAPIILHMFGNCMSKLITGTTLNWRQGLKITLMGNFGAGFVTGVIAHRPNAPKKPLYL